MNQKDHSLIEKMNITTEAIVGNQCDRNSVEEFIYNGKLIRYFNFAERGVGLNRNNTLMRANAEIVLFADDDMVYFDNYERIVQDAFIRIPQADVIVFNLKENQSVRKIYKKESRVGYFNYMRYGTARIAARLYSIRKHGIYFNQCFGGGTEHSHGEDTLFLHACLKKGLKIIACPDYIAELKVERQSTWNKGFDEKYLEDQGCLYKTISRKYWKLLCLQDAIRRSQSYGVPWYKAYSLMKKGAKNY